jgi:hypothetical protein
MPVCYAKKALHVSAVILLRRDVLYEYSYRNCLVHFLVSRNGENGKDANSV